MRSYSLAPFNAARKSILCVLTLVVWIASGAAPAAGVEIRGRVLGPDNRGLSSARLEALEVLSRGDAALSSYRRVMEPQETSQPVEATASVPPGGSYSLPLSPGIWELRVSAPGHVSQCLTVVPLVEERRIPTVRLSLAEPLTVRVVKPEGKPLEGAFVKTSPRPRDPNEWGRCSLLATTDENGEAALAAAASESGSSLTVDVFLPGYEPVRRRVGDGAAITLRRAPEVSLDLEVVDPGATEDTAPARVVAVAGEGRWGVALSDPKGRLSLSTLPDSSGQLTLLTSDGRALDISIPPGAVEKTQKITLPKNRVFEGRVGEATAEGPVAIPDALVWDPAELGSWTPVSRDGRYRLLNVAVDGDRAPGPRLVLAAQAPGYERLDQEFDVPCAPEAGGGKTLEYGDLDFWLSSMRGLVSVRGRLVDQENQPVPEAVVTFAAGPPHRWNDESVKWPLAGIEPLGTRPERSPSDAEGVFTVHARAGLYNVVVTHSSLAPELVPGVRIPESAEPVDVGVIHLKPGHRVEGFVEDGEGEALAGVSVELIHPFQRGDETLYIPDQRYEPVVTDVTGAFHFDHLPDLAVALKAGKPDFVEETVPLRPPEREPVRIVLKPTASLSGRVVDESDQPVAGAEAILEAEDVVEGSPGPLGPVPRARVLGTARTDRKGFFEISGAPPGTWRLNVRAEGFAPATVDGLVFVAGETVSDVEVLLRRGALLSGRVLTPEGLPVFDARVSAAGQQTIAEKDGSFRFAQRVSPGSYQIRAEHSDFGAATETTTIGASTDQEQVELILEPRLVLAGRVVDAETRVVKGGTVVLRALDFDRSSFETTDDRGRFAFRNVEAGRYSLVARDGVTEERIELSLGSASVENLEIVIPPAGRIRGRVLGLPPDQLRAVFVTCKAPERPDGCRLSVNQDGDFTTGPIPLGTWTVVASVVGAERWAAQTVVLTPDERDKAVELELGSGRPGAQDSAGL